MNIGHFGITGLTSTSFQQIDATTSYSRCLRWLARFNPAITCLALVFVFFGAVGSMAQDTTQPTGVITYGNELSTSGFRYHNGITAIPLAVTFSEPVFSLTGGPIDHTGIDFGVAHEPRGVDGVPPKINGFKQDPENPLRYTFIATPVANNPYTYVPFLRSGHYKDAADNLNRTDDFFQIRYQPPVMPIADAGMDKTVDSGVIVALDGSGSTGDTSATLSYSWVGTSGSGGSVTLSDANVAQPTFMAENLTAGAADVTYVFTLTVTDNLGSPASIDTVTVTVRSMPPDTTPPTARFEQLPPSHDGETPFKGTVVFDEEAKGIGVRLKGHLIGADGTDYNDVEDKPQITNGEKDPTRLRYTFTVTPNAGLALYIRLNKGYKDLAGNRGIRIDSPPIPYVSAENNLEANAGPDQTVASGTQDVELDGTGSTLTGGGRKVTYLWTRTGGDGDPSVVPSDPDALQTSFTAETLNPGDASVTHIFTLRVSDDQGTPETTDMVTITVTAPPFASLVAEAGDPQTVDPGDTVTLEGSGTATGSGRTVTYAWTQTGGDAAIVTLSDTTVLDPSFTAQALTGGAADVTYIFTLTVRDDQDTPKATDTVTITVISPFAAPKANAGEDKAVASGTKVILDGSGSTVDRRRTPKTYAWSWAGGTTSTSVDLTDAYTAHPSFTANTLARGASDETHVFLLIVTDSGGDNAPDTVTITVTAPPPLVAQAGADQTVASGTQDVELDGTGSTLTGGGSDVTYLWTPVRRDR